MATYPLEPWAYLSLDDLRTMGFQAILVTAGAQGTKWLGLPGEDLEGVYHAKDGVYFYNQLPPYSQKSYLFGKRATATVRTTATRRFALRDGAWVDERPAAAQARVVAVKPFSPAYFAVMERVAELREAFALGERVEVHGRAVTVRLAADGAERLDEAALAALTRDW